MNALFIILAGICWGLDGLLRSQIVGISPLTIVTLEHLIGFLILAVVGIQHLTFPKLSRKAWACLIGVALFSGLIGTYAFTWAMAHVSYTSFGVLFLLLKIQPIFAIMAAAIFLRERPKKLFYLEAFIAIIAAYFLSFGAAGLHMPDVGSDTKRAIFAGLIAALCWGSATVFSRYLSQQGYKARTITCFRLGMVAILGSLFLVFGFLFGFFEFQNSSILNFELGTLNLIISVALLSGVLGTTMYYRGIKHISASLASIFELSFPLTGFLIDISYYDKTYDIYQILGGLALIAVMTIISSGMTKMKNEEGR